MISLSQIEIDLVLALKNRDRLLADTLRGLKLRIQNEQIAKTSQPEAGQPLAGAKISARAALNEEEILALVKSEVKRRKEAVAAYRQGGREELAEKEFKEAEILSKYLPPQLTEAELGKIVEEVLAAGQYAAKDFGLAMKAVKAKTGSGADGAVLAKLLKEKLK